MFSSHSSPGSSTAPLPKRRRVSLACSSCRQRKSRCDGHRPNCSPCLELGIYCAYEVPSRDNNPPKSLQSINPNSGECHKEKAQLGRKVVEIPRITPSSGTQTSTLQPKPTAGITSVLPLNNDNIGQASGEVQVDTLATATFDGVTERTDHNIGYFGPTSNHAFFRNVSDILLTVVRVFSVANSSWASHGIDPVPPSSASARHEEASRVTPHAVDIYTLPNRQDVTLLINQFSSTVGIVLPIVNSPYLLHEYDKGAQENNKQLPRSVRALLNIVCAYACYTIGGAETEAYYRRAVALLDEQTLRGSSLALVQALLLVGSFQQNNQRSITSWTFHAIAVKAAFQLGLHSPMYYKDYTSEDSELRKRVWYAVVSQDRYLSISLGRPCMIPQQHIQVQIPEVLDHNNGLLYFNHIISLDEVKGSVIDSLYGYNIESEPLPMQELVIRRLQLSWKLEQWRQNLSSFCNIVTGTDLSQWSRASYSANRLQVLLSIQYYSTSLLINGPVLTRFLSERVKELQHDETDDAILVDTILLVIKNDLETAKNLSEVISGVIDCGESFLECNVAWWQYNYIMFTVNLHLFAILLALKCYGTTLAARGIEIADVRKPLGHSLTILRNFERSSLMSRKAGHCMLEFLRAFDSLSSEQRPPSPTLDTSWTVPEDVNVMPQNTFPQYILQATNAFLFQSSDGAFLDEPLDFSWGHNAQYDA